MSDSIAVDPYVFETLMRDLIGHDRRAGSYLVYLAILAAARDRPVALSHQQLADKTGLSKCTVQDAVAHLARRGLIAVHKRERTEAALLAPLAPWRRLPRP